MTFQEIQEEVIRTRFKESQRESIKSWINTRYQGIWGFVDWPWKRQGPVDLEVEANDANPVVPAGFLRPVMIFDDLGNELRWMEPDEFDREHRYQQVNSVTARPGAFKWVDNVITLGPTPGQAYNFGLVYDRKMTHLAGGTLPTTGAMTDNDDTPIWDDTYHYILVVGAIATGLRMENDPTFPQMEEEFTGLLSSMRDHYLPTASPGSHLTYGTAWDYF